MPAPDPAVVTRLRAAGCVFAEDEAALLTAAAHSPADLATLVDRRVTGLPLEQVLGWAAFAGRRVTVAGGVFVPRRRSQLLVQQVVALLGDQPGRIDPVVVADVCCGAGAIGLAVVDGWPRVRCRCMPSTSTRRRWHARRRTWPPSEAWPCRATWWPHCRSHLADSSTPSSRARLTCLPARPAADGGARPRAATGSGRRT